MEDLFVDLCRAMSSVPELKARISSAQTSYMRTYQTIFFHPCFARCAVCRICALYEWLYFAVIPRLLALSPQNTPYGRLVDVVDPQFAVQDKMNKVLDLWSKNSTFPSHLLAKLKGLVNEGDSSAQGAYFEHLYLVLPSILYHVRNCITLVDLAPVDCLYAIKRRASCPEHINHSFRNPLFLRGIMKTERIIGRRPLFFI